MGRNQFQWTPFFYSVKVVQIVNIALLFLLLQSHTPDTVSKSFHLFFKTYAMVPSCSYINLFLNHRKLEISSNVETKLTTNGHEIEQVKSILQFGNVVTTISGGCKVPDS